MQLTIIYASKLVIRSGNFDGAQDIINRATVVLTYVVNKATDVLASSSVQDKLEVTTN
jgi:hypothetical protein